MIATKHLMIVRVRALLWVALLGFVPSEAWALGKAGIGSGLPYGTPLLGFGIEVDLGDHVAALGGVGVGNYEAPWAVGARLSLKGPRTKWRPHVTGMYWTEGYGVYAGVDHDVGKPGGLVLTYGIGFGNVNLEARVGAMIGVGYRF